MSWQSQKQGLCFLFLASQFFSPLIYLLIFAAVISFFLGDQKDALVILIVVILNALIGAVQEGRAEQSIASLRKLSRVKARVRRDGQEQEMSSFFKFGHLTQICKGEITS